jgi:SAM-dependent methyltransferase
MDLQELQSNWNQFGRLDPLFAILTNPEKRENRWNVDEFFHTGENEIKSVIGYLNALCLPLTFGRALDFGCGVGRLTQALCRYFKECDGVDIACSMIDQARELNRFGHRCRYHINTVEDLQLFGSDTFDFIYSTIVLQHMEPRYSSRYIQEFLRVLKPRGIALFQIPSELVITSSEPLPDAACNATIIPKQYPRSMFAGEKAQIRVQLRNSSSVTWPGANGLLPENPVRLRNYWLRSDKSVISMNDGRTTLNKDLEPTEQIELALTVTAPPDSGEYVLGLDMVQEGICWFHHNKSIPIQVPIQVTSDHALPGRHFAARNSTILPRAEMHCILRETIVELVRSSGASIVDIFDDPMAGRAYIGYRYCITK